MTVPRVRRGDWPYAVATDELAADESGHLHRWERDPEHGEAGPRLFAGRLFGMLAEDFPAELLPHLDALRAAWEAAEAEGRRLRREDEAVYRSLVTGR